MTDIEIKNLKNEIKNLEDRLKCTKGERAQIIRDQLKEKKALLNNANNETKVCSVIGTKTITEKENLTRHASVTMIDDYNK